MRELKVTEHNHAEMDAVVDRGWRWDEVLSAMLDLNNVLDEELGGNTDWGGKYASWMDSFGIDSNTENGWWSLAAIDPDNLQAFIDVHADDSDLEFQADCESAKAKIRDIQAVGSFEPRTKKVRELVSQLLPHNAGVQAHE